MLNKVLENKQFKTDEHGRIVIEDMELLKSITGALGAPADFMPPDVACGNGNCAC